ncbi:MAG: flippase-like domain-containing protein [Bacteroidales bacterium]|nr:flippase-like domain-containing protein [Bacteroidales bacterium]
MKIKLPPFVKVLIKLAITVAALWYVFARIDLQQLIGTIGQSNFFYLAGALLLFVLSKMISSVRLNRYLGSIGIHISERTNMKLYLLGMYYNLFLPGGIGGDGYKIYLLNRKYEVSTRRIFWAVMMDRIIGVVALFCMAVILFCFIPGMGTYAWYTWMLIPLSISITYLVFRRFFPYLLPVFRITNLHSLVVQLLQLLSALLILLSLKVPGNLEGYLFVFLISSMVAVLPLTIGGIGSREFTFMLGAQWLGLDLNLSIALSLLFYLITAFTSLWGIIYSVGQGLKLEE